MLNKQHWTSQMRPDRLLRGDAWVYSGPWPTGRSTDLRPHQQNLPKRKVKRTKRIGSRPTSEHKLFGHA